MLVCLDTNEFYAQFIHRRNNVGWGVFEIMSLYDQNSLRWVASLICTVECYDLQEAFLLNDD